eukprot:SAG31_NODE_4549_length_3146_cov_1.492944_3_plen_120_part_00
MSSSLRDFATGWAYRELAAATADQLPVNDTNHPIAEKATNSASTFDSTELRGAYCSDTHKLRLLLADRALEINADELRRACTACGGWASGVVGSVPERWELLGNYVRSASPCTISKKTC